MSKIRGQAPDEPGYPPDRDPRDWYRKAAQAGDQEARRILAWLLGEFPRSDDDLVEAVELKHQLALSGDAVAMHDYGVTLDSAEEVEPWLRRSAGLGWTPAMVNLAGLLRRRGDDASRQEADRWLHAAAERGDPVASLGLSQPGWPDGCD